MRRVSGGNKDQRFLFRYLYIYCREINFLPEVNLSFETTQFWESSLNCEKLKQEHE